MPLIQITLAAPGIAATSIRELQQATTQLMQSILHKDAALTVVSVTQLPVTAMTAGGQAVSTGASLQAMITAGSNSAAEKADFISAAKKMLTAVIGSTAAPLYIALHELPATDWGYGGRTQAARRAELLSGGAA